MPIEETPYIPQMDAFAIALDWPSVRIGNDMLGIAWEGMGPLGVPILMRGDGVVIFNFKSVERFDGPAIPSYTPAPNQKIPSEITRLNNARNRVLYERSQYMNAWLTCYTSAMATIQKFGITATRPTDPNEHLRAVFIDGYWIVYGQNLMAIDTIAKFNKKLEIDAETLNHANMIFIRSEELFGENFSTVLSLFHLSVYSYRTHQFSTSLLTAWAIAEQVINAIWTGLLREKSGEDDSTTHISRDRFKILTGRDYTASIVTQILSLLGTISDDTLHRLDKSRKDRNNFIHSLKMPDAEAAQDAVLIASSLLSSYLGIEIAASLSYSSWT